MHVRHEMILNLEGGFGSADHLTVFFSDCEEINSIHHLLDAISETANVQELRQKLLHTTPSGWWWRIESLFRVTA